jgi:wobble nucleotide-excising tRNase
MINRFSGEIHINPIVALRKGDFNNDGLIEDIASIVDQAVQFNVIANEKLRKIKEWLARKNSLPSATFSFTDGGFISINNLPDTQLKEMASQGLIDLFDFANNKDWVKKHGHEFGLSWENGRAVEI